MNDSDDRGFVEKVDWAGNPVKPSRSSTPPKRRNSRSKGKRGELDAVRALHRLGIRTAERGARNGVPGGADIVGVPGVHLEVKRRGRLAVTGFMTQSATDAQPGEVPAVLLREDGRPWLVLVALEDLDGLAERLRQARGL